MTALVDRATIERNADKILERVSPSQVDLFELCPARWYNAHIRGLREEMTAAAIRGTNVATLVEDYYLLGVDPEVHVKHAALAPLARPVIAIYGPRRSSITAEEWVVMQTEPGLPVVRGRYDLFDCDPKASKIIRGFEDESGVPVLGDTKCRSSFRYAKSTDPESGDDKYIGADLQLNMYASAIVDGLGLERVGLMHAYSLTDARRPPQGKPVGIVVSAEDLLPRRRKTIESVRQMAAWAKERPDTADPLPKNTTACSQYRPNGCPYRGLCGIDATTGSWAQDEGNAAPKENATMENRQGPTLMERMKAERDRLAGGGTAAPEAASSAPAQAAVPAATQAAAPAAASSGPTAHEMAVARANAAIETGMIKFDDSGQVFAKEGADAGWLLRVPTEAERQAFAATTQAAPAAQRSTAAEPQIRAPDAPPPTNQPGDASADEGSKKKKGRVPKGDAPASTPTPAETAGTPAPAAAAPSGKVPGAGETVARTAPASGEPVTIRTENEAAASKAQVPRGIVLYLDCLPAKGEHAGKAVDYNEWLEPIMAQATKALGLVDWRLDFANKSEGALAAAIRSNVHTLPTAITVSGYSKARSVFLECVAPLAAAVVKGISG